GPLPGRTVAGNTDATKRTGQGDNRTGPVGLVRSISNSHLSGRRGRRARLENRHDRTGLSHPRSSGSVDRAVALRKGSVSPARSQEGLQTSSCSGCRRGRIVPVPPARRTPAQAARGHLSGAKPFRPVAAVFVASGSFF